MVSAEEKRDFVMELEDEWRRSAPTLEIQRHLHELLLRDTQDGKLYKYRSFDTKGYALENLKSGTLHCSRPDAFNDPFDCKIGITFNSILEAMFDREFEIIANVFTLYVSVIDGTIAIENCTTDEQRILRSLFASERLNRFASQCGGNEKTDEEIVQLLQENVDVIFEIVQILLADDIFSRRLGLSANMISQMTKDFTPQGVKLLCDDNVSLEDYARAYGITEDTDEIALTLLMVKKSHPELAKAADELLQYIDDRGRQMTNKIAALFQVGCLCTSYKNSLMWSHYADSHKGFCIEYDFGGTDEETLLKLPLPVIYSKKRPPIPWKPAFANTKENIEEATVQLMLGLLTKDQDWKYENEWRILIKASECADFTMPPVSCIYLGAAIEEKNRKKILKIAKQLGVPVKQMKVDRGAYALHAENVT